jgi:hypothetical protein
MAGKRLFRWAARCLLACLVLAMPALASSVPALASHAIFGAPATERALAFGNGAALPLSQAAIGSGATGPVDIAIAVDESGSITPEEMVQERTAARQIALGEYAPDSKVVVIGFAGADALNLRGHVRQTPFDQVCPLTEVSSPAQQQILNDCIGLLHARTYTQGWNTNFIAVIDQAVSDLDNAGDSGRPKLLFLLTDGYLDVYGDAAFTGTPQQVNTQAQNALLHQALPLAKANGVEIWPVGFGQADYSELSEIAAGGAQAQCTDLPKARPHAITVASAAEAEAVLPTVYAYARCVYPGPIRRGFVRGSLNIPVTVPVIAADGVIEVVRQSPRIQVSFLDPENRQVPASGDFDGSTFSLGGADDTVMDMRITDPLPGTWTVHFHAPPGDSGTLVQVRVFWRAVLRSDIVVTPPEPTPGSKVIVEVRLELHGSTINDPAALAGIKVSAQVSGAGIVSPVTVPLADNGIAPDQTASDGVYSGYLVIPKSANGALSFTGLVTGQGVTGDENIFTTSILAQSLALVGQISLNQRSVTPGGTVTGSLLLNNETGQSHQIRLVLVGTASGVTVSPSSLAISAASGASSPQDFAIRFARGVPLGSVSGELRAVDPADPAHVYAQSFLTVVVALPAAWYAKYWWLEAIGLLIAVLALTGLLRQNVSRRRGEDMSDIELMLFSGDRDIPVQSLPAPAGCGRKFRFSVDMSQSDRPRLELDTTGLGYAARRGKGTLRVTMPGEEPVEIELGERGDIGNGLALGYRDHRLDEPDMEPEWPDDGDDPDLRTGGWLRRRRRRPDDEGAVEPVGDAG